MRKLFVLLLLLIWAATGHLYAQIYFEKSGGSLTITYPATLSATTTVTVDTVITSQGTASSDAYAARRHYIFQNLDRSPITTGILLDFAADFTEPGIFGGSLSSSNQVDMLTWRSLYGTLYTGRISPAFTQPDLETVNDRIETYTAPGDPIPIPILHFNYHSLRPDAVDLNLLRVSNDQLFDVAGRSQSPYQLKTVFAACPTQPYSRNGSATFILRPELFFNSTGKTVSTIQVDFGNGQGYQNVGWNTPVSVGYTSAGDKTIKVKFTYSDGTVAESHSNFGVLQATATARYQAPAQATQPFAARAGIHSGGELFIRYSAKRNNFRIVQPLIIVEGYDISHIKTYQEEGNTFENFLVRLNAPALQGYDFNSALDDVAGYDLLYLNYNRGTDDIKRNAALFQEVLDWINTQKRLNGSTATNVVIGESMGGLVARYGLADLGRQGIPTETRLLITMDSPHRGANVPLGFQGLGSDIADFSILGLRLRSVVRPLKDLRVLLDEPATRQLLIVQDGRVNTFLDGEYRQMVDRGIPNCRVIAVSDGSECGQGQGYSPYAELLRVKANAYANGLIANTFSPLLASTLGIAYFLGSNGTLAGRSVRSAGVTLAAFIGIIALNPFYNKNWKMDVVVNALPDRQVQRVFGGRLSVEKKILFLIPIQITLWNKSRYSTADMLAWDSAPGGFYDLKQIQQRVPGNPNINAYPIVSANLEVDLRDRFNFVPVVSALDLTTINASTLYGSYTGGSSPGNAARVANFVTQERIAGTTPLQYNQDHTFYTPRNSRWIYDEMQTGPVANSCAALCSAAVISGDFPPSACVGTTVQFSVPNYGPGHSYNWSVGGRLQIISGQGTSAITVKVVSSGYDFVSLNIGTPCGTVALPTRNFNLSCELTVIAEGPSYLTGCQTGTWTANAAGGVGGYSYSWRLEKGGSFYGSGTGSTFSFYNSAESAQFALQLTVTSGSQTATDTKYFMAEACGGFTFQTYPNPASDYVEVAFTARDSTQLDLPSLPEEYELSIYNKYSQKVITQKSRQKKQRFNTEALPADIYYLHIMYRNQTVKQQLVINHQ